MQKTNPNILSTRPLSDTLIEHSARHNINIDTASFIQTKPVIDAVLATQIHELSKRSITAVFTSVNGVMAIADIFQKPKNWNVYSISNTTARRITEVFKMHISGMAANAEALADVIINAGLEKVYFFCSNIRRDALSEKLRAANITVEEIVVYETIETPTLITKDYDGILFYSPSGVHSFFSMNAVQETTRLFAIGFTTAETILQYTTNPVLIADKPDKEDLVHQVIQHFNTNKREA